jgi:hypothetical protein
MAPSFKLEDIFSVAGKVRNAAKLRLYWELIFRLSWLQVVGLVLAKVRV